MPDEPSAVTYHTIDDWLDEIENFATRHERLATEIREGTTTAVMPWLETAWRLGGEAKAKADAERIAELESTLKAALDCIGHPDDRTVQAMRAVLSASRSPADTRET